MAGAAGFLLGRSVVAPGDLLRSDALVLSGRRRSAWSGRRPLLLLVAGLIEGFVSAGTGGVVVRASGQRG